MKIYRYHSIYTLLSVVLVFFSTYAKAETSETQSTILNKMCASDLYAVDTRGEHIWTTSSGGVVYHSPDFGKSWQVQQVGLPNEFFSISFLDELNGWAVGRFGVIAYTSDGGRTWQIQRKETPKNSANLYKVQFMDKNNGWAVGELSLIVYTVDGGKTWVDTSLGEDKILFGMHFIDSQTGWVVGELGAMAHTIDGGKTWTNQKPPDSEKSFYSVYFKNQTEGWACGIDGIILWTKDGGSNWQPVQSVPGADNLYDIGFTGSQFWAIGMNGIMLESENGLGWQIGVKNHLTYQWLMDLATTKKGELVICGAKGTIISTSDAKSWRVSRQMRLCVEVEK